MRGLIEIINTYRQVNSSTFNISRLNLEANKWAT